MCNKAVEIQEVPKSYGRRFKVIVNGQASDDMAFKEILKQVEELSKNITEPQITKLENAQDLLTKVKDTHIASKANYKTRTRFQRFISWFLRLGNEGSHKENIQKLETSLKQNILQLKQNLINAEEAKCGPDNPRLIFNSKPIDTFINENLPVFQAAIAKRGETSFKLSGYDVHIKDPNTLIINNGNEELTLNFDNPSPIPDPFIPILQRTFEHVITNTSSYSDLSNKIVQSTLKEFPVWHLNQLAETSLKTNLRKDSKFHPGDIKTRFYDNDLKQQKGIDSQGLTRSYIGTLVDSIQNQDSLFASCKDGLRCPRIERTSSRKEPVMNCTKNEAEVYYNLGMLLRTTYNADKRSFATGVYFSDILFDTVFCFSDSQLQQPFDKLSRAELIRLSSLLALKLPWDPESSEKANVMMALSLCKKTALHKCLENGDLKTLTTAAFVGVADKGMEKYLADDLFNANMEAIKADMDGFIEQLSQSIFSSNQLIPQLNGASLGEILAPIHSMARGMATNDKESWIKIRNKGVNEFNLRIQGEIDKQTIHDALKNKTHERENELKWLREWILSEATNDDIKQFLRFISGSTGLPKDATIEVQNCYGKHPISNTCYLRINLPSNVSKEEFIANLKEAIQVSDFGRS